LLIMVRQSDPPAIVEFGNFRIFPHRRQLLAEGRPIALGGRAFDVLMALIEASGAVVGKAELLRLAWQGRIVDENRVASEIVALRKAFGPDRELIRTVAGRGYQFTGEIRVRSEGERAESGTVTAGAEPPHRVESDRASLPLPNKPAIAAALSPLRPRLSIVILPFLNLSQDPSEDYFVDGICDSLITELSQALPGSFVISRSTAFTYKGRQVVMRQIGQELGVRYVLEGSVLAGARHVRVNAQLIDAETDEHLWAERFDKERKDILAVQEEIVARLSRSVGIEMVRSEAARGNSGSGGAEIADAMSVTKHNVAERRQITAMSCEAVGVAARADDSGLEDLLEVIGAFQHCVSEIAGRHNGFIASRLGNTVLVLFGYPAAHEHDAERAIQAGLELCTAVKTLIADADAPMRCRVGIATGMVIVGDLVGAGQSRNHGIVGDTPDLAMRLQVSAQPDTVTIEPTTWRLIGNLFDCRDLGALDTNTDTGSIHHWQVLGESVVASRFEALRGAKLTPLVGRDDEIDLLLRRWARAKAGDGQVVLVSGEAGIGKSRITAAFGERLHAEPHLRLRHFCLPYHQNSALSPIIDQIGRAAGFAPDDPAAAKLEKLETLLARAAPPDEDVALLGDLMSLPASQRHPLPNLSPQRKKERTLEALIRQLEGLAREKPVVVLWEDAHWLDPTSRELLDLTVEHVRSLPVLLIVTFRPEFQPPWAGQPQVSMLALNRLDRRDRTALVAQTAGSKRLPAEVISQIADRTDGVPLFVEELTKSVLESGLLREENDRYVLERPLQPLAIPMTLHASLLARLDRLASVRHVAQIGAAIGRQFSYPVLHTVSRLPEDELRAALTRLVASELVFERGTPPDAVYSFKHALVQDVAHGSLLRDARRQLHAQIAEALETHSPEITESQPEVLAQHYAEAGLVEKSVVYWGKAGHRSVARSAMAEALAQLQKGLDQLALLPDTPERQRQELEFLSALGVMLNAVEGHSARETGQAYARARELWERLGSPAEFRHVPHGQSRYHAYRGELNLALRLDQELLDQSLRRNDSGGLVLGHISSGRNLMHAGRFTSSRSHLEAVLALYDPNFHRSLGRQTGIHPQLAAQAHLGIVLFCLGFPDQALARSLATIAEAQQLAHPRSLSVALALGCRLLVLLGDDASLGQWADELAGVAAKHGLAVGAQGTVYHGWVKVKQDHLAEGMSLLRAGSTAYRARQADLWMPHFLALLAEACEIAGEIEEGLTLLDDGLGIAERTGARWFAAELNRQKGRLVLQQGHTEAAEELYRKALGIAREQQAKLWELRAAGSLARLWRNQGRRAAAHDLLAPVNGWFSEGFATPDLKAAKALLDELDL
jgi:TolB-like protein/DNA-binding winged helix-turn-helix (wHTH) protein/predicted ATPase